MWPWAGHFATVNALKTATVTKMRPDSRGSSANFYATTETENEPSKCTTSANAACPSDKLGFFTSLTKLFSKETEI